MIAALLAASLVVVEIDLSDQMAYVYEDGEFIDSSPVSTGRPGKETPTGYFTILQKKVEHVSTIYHVQMPYMQRLTWDGIALHEGRLPGYPASAGCVRLPPDFARRLYALTDIGTEVVIRE